MARELTVLGAQTGSIPFDPDATLVRFEDEVGRFAATFPHVDLMAFPELYLSAEDPFGPHEPRGYARDVAQPIPGPTTDRIAKAAADARCWIAAGSILERSDAGIHNTAVVFSPSGELTALHRKLTPWAPWERTVPGDSLTYFDIPERGRVGLMICYEGWFPEIARGLALAGAEAILQCSLTATSDRTEELVLARATAITNQCYVVNVNGTATLGGGRSIVCDPEGHVLFEGGAGEEFFIETIDFDRATSVRRRGTRGLNLLEKHLRESPGAVFEHYRDLLDRPPGFTSRSNRAERNR